MNTKRKVTVEEAKALTAAVNDKLANMLSDHGFNWIAKHDEDSYKTWKHTYEMLPLFLVDERYLCCAECGYGHDIVFDIKTNDVFVTSRGIFEKDWCYMSDYYGYPEGAFFYRV